MYVSLIEGPESRTPFWERLLDVAVAFSKLGFSSSNQDGSRLSPSRLIQLFVKEKKFCRGNEFRELMSLANAVPGITVVQLITSVAAVHAGLAGAAIATLCIILPGIVLNASAGALLAYCIRRNSEIDSEMIDASSSWRLPSSSSFVDSFNSNISPSNSNDDVTNPYDSTSSSSPSMLAARTTLNEGNSILTSRNSTTTLSDNEIRNHLLHFHMKSFGFEFWVNVFLHGAFVLFVALALEKTIQIRFKFAKEKSSQFVFMLGFLVAVLLDCARVNHDIGNPSIGNPSTASNGVEYTGTNGSEYYDYTYISPDKVKLEMNEAAGYDIYISPDKVKLEMNEAAGYDGRKSAYGSGNLEYLVKAKKGKKRKKKEANSNEKDADSTEEEADSTEKEADSTEKEETKKNNETKEIPRKKPSENGAGNNMSSNNIENRSSSKKTTDKETSNTENGSSSETSKDSSSRDTSIKSETKGRSISSISSSQLSNPVSDSTANALPISTTPSAARPSTSGTPTRPADSYLHRILAYFFSMDHEFTLYDFSKKIFDSLHFMELLTQFFRVCAVPMVLILAFFDFPPLLRSVPFRSTSVFGGGLTSNRLKTTMVWKNSADIPTDSVGVNARMMKLNTGMNTIDSLSAGMNAGGNVTMASNPNGGNAPANIGGSLGGSANNASGILNSASRGLNTHLQNQEMLQSDITGKGAGFSNQSMAGSNAIRSIGKNQGANSPKALSKKNTGNSEFDFEKQTNSPTSEAAAAQQQQQQQGRRGYVPPVLPTGNSTNSSMACKTRNSTGMTHHRRDSSVMTGSVSVGPNLVQAAVGTPGGMQLQDMHLQQNMQHSMQLQVQQSQQSQSHSQSRPGMMMQQTQSQMTLNNNASKAVKKNSVANTSQNNSLNSPTSSDQQSSDEESRDHQSSDGQQSMGESRNQDYRSPNGPSRYKGEMDDTLMSSADDHTAYYEKPDDSAYHYEKPDDLAYYYEKPTKSSIFGRDEEIESRSDSSATSVLMYTVNSIKSAVVNKINLSPSLNRSSLTREKLTKETANRELGRDGDTAQSGNQTQYMSSIINMNTIKNLTMDTMKTLRSDPNAGTNQNTNIRNNGSCFQIQGVLPPAPPQTAYVNILRKNPFATGITDPSAFYNVNERSSRGAGMQSPRGAGMHQQFQNQGHQFHEEQHEDATPRGTTLKEMNGSNMTEGVVEGGDFAEETPYDESGYGQPPFKNGNVNMNTNATTTTIGLSPTSMIKQNTSNNMNMNLSKLKEDETYNPTVYTQQSYNPTVYTQQYYHQALPQIQQQLKGNESLVSQILGIGEDKTMEPQIVTGIEPYYSSDNQFSVSQFGGGNTNNSNSTNQFGNTQFTGSTLNSMNLPTNKNLIPNSITGIPGSITGIIPGIPSTMNLPMSKTNSLSGIGFSGIIPSGLREEIMDDAKTEESYFGEEEMDVEREFLVTYTDRTGRILIYTSCLIIFLSFPLSCLSFPPNVSMMNPSMNPSMNLSMNPSMNPSMSSPCSMVSSWILIGSSWISWMASYIRTGFVLFGTGSWIETIPVLLCENIVPRHIIFVGLVCARILPSASSRLLAVNAAAFSVGYGNYLIESANTIVSPVNNVASAVSASVVSDVDPGITTPYFVDDRILLKAIFSGVCSAFCLALPGLLLMWGILPFWSVIREALFDPVVGTINNVIEYHRYNYNGAINSNSLLLPRIQRLHACTAGLVAAAAASLMLEAVHSNSRLGELRLCTILVVSGSRLWLFSKYTKERSLLIFGGLVWVLCNFVTNYVTNYKI